MKVSENKARVYSLLKHQRKKIKNSGGIDRLEVPFSWPTMQDYDDTIDYELEDPKTLDPKNSSQWREINYPREIEFYLRLQNQRHFGQAEGTPFTSSSMKKKFDWSAFTQEAELVLNGEYTDEELTNVQQMFLNNLQRISQNKVSTNYITTEDFDGKMRKWKETTSTSPSSRHLRHYKVLVSTIDRSLQEDDVKDLRRIQH